MHNNNKENIYEDADNNLQKPNIYNQYSPYYESIKRQRFK
ncbi:unnamed protein product, partial [Rotaria sordida]